MLPFKHRLTKHKDIERVQKSGYPYFLENLVMKITKNGLKDVRIGFLAGSKSFRLAVERNQMKRLLRETFRPELGFFEPGTDVLVSIRRKEGEKITPEKIKQNVQDILKKAGLKGKTEIK